MYNPSIKISPRFASSLERVSPAIYNQVFRKTHLMVNQFRYTLGAFRTLYDKVEGLGTNDVLEVDLGGNPRMLVHCQGSQFTLLDVGTHEVVPRYGKKFLTRDLATAEPASAAYWPDQLPVGNFFNRNPELQTAQYGNEVAPEWVYFLSDKQNGIAASILRGIKQSNVHNPKFYFIIGGPGTGKTSILLRLFMRLAGQEIDSDVMMSEPVANYTMSAGGIDNLRQFLVSPDTFLERWFTGNWFGTDRSVVLYDDPDEPEYIENLLAQSKGKLRSAVIGFDPYQLNKDVTDEYMARMESSYGVKRYTMNECYRQKKNVGTATKRLIDKVAAASPYRAREKVATFHSEHQVTRTLANDLTFPNPYGYEQVYAPAARENVVYEVQRIRASPIWRHSVPVLLVIEESVTNAVDWDRTLDRIGYKGVIIKDKDYDGLMEVKGLEFQHVFINISGALFDRLESGRIGGDGNGSYLRDRLLRIPWSRAKDTVVAFVWRLHPTWIRIG